MSPYVTSGSFYVPGQYHFHMETQVKCHFFLPAINVIRLLQYERTLGGH